MLKSEELLNVKGGANFSAALLNSLSRIVTVIFELGKSIGTSLRRVKEKNYCKIS